MKKDYYKNIFKKNPDTISRMIDNELILLPLGEEINIEDTYYYYILKNKTAKYIWALIDGKRNVGQIKKYILQKYQVETEKVENHLLNFLKKLKEIKAII